MLIALAFAADRGPEQGGWVIVIFGVLLGHLLDRLPARWLAGSPLLGASRDFAACPRLAEPPRSWRPCKRVRPQARHVPRQSELSRRIRPQSRSSSHMSGAMRFLCCLFVQLQFLPDHPHATIDLPMPLVGIFLGSITHETPGVLSCAQCSEFTSDVALTKLALALRWT